MNKLTFYVTSGNVEVVVEAESYEDAAKKGLAKVFNGASKISVTEESVLYMMRQFGLIIDVSTEGFGVSEWHGMTHDLLDECMNYQPQPYASYSQQDQPYVPRQRPPSLWKNGLLGILKGLSG